MDKTRYIHVTFTDGTWLVYSYLPDEGQQFRAAMTEFSTRLTLDVKVFAVYAK